MRKLKFKVPGYNEDGTGGGVAGLDEDGEDARQEEGDALFLIHEIRAGRAHFPECGARDGGACICMQTLEEIGEDF